MRRIWTGINSRPVPDSSSNRQDRRRESGALFVELMLGLVLAVLTLGSVITIVTTNARLRRVDREVGLALFAGRKALEEARLTPLDDIMTLDGSSFTVSDGMGGNNGLTATDDDDDGFPGSISVTLESSSGAFKVYRVVTKVDWAGAGGVQNLTLQSFVSDRGY